MKTVCKWLRRLLIAALGAALLLAAALLVYARMGHYDGDGAARAALRSGEGVTVTEGKDRIVFAPESGRSGAGLIFYPGGKVDEIAYAPLMKEIAGRGVMCVLLRMPFDLAILDVNAAAGITEEYPDTDWYVGGHSLGGVTAALYAGRHPGEMKGLLLLGAFPPSDLQGSGLKVLTVVGDRDGVMSREAYEKARAYLPPDARELILEGGNHAGFGSYGPQKGDGEALISGEAQRRMTAEAFREMVGLSPKQEE